MNVDSNDYSLDGRTALVSGAVGLIGTAICREFARAGARIVVTDIDREACATLAESLRQEFGVDTYAIASDVSDAAGMRAMARTVSEGFGVCDAIVVNAGVLALAPVLELDDATWSRVISINLTGAFNTARAFAAEMVRTGATGTIVFSSSLFGTRGGAGNAAYSASKFGILGLAQSMAADLAPQGIRVNSVCPGQIESTMMNGLFETRATERGTTPDAERASFVARIPMGDLGSVDEVARAYRYLSSAASGYITGQHLVIDGGWQVG